MIKRMPQGEADIPVTSMLDMAFQLLTFFIMTFNPTPTEGQFSMNLLPASPQVDVNNTSGEANDQPNPDVPAALRTMKTQLFAGPGGELGHVLVGEVEVRGMDELRAKLREILSDKSLPFDQALIMADPKLKYEELMRVIDIFSGLDITKISFSELDTNAAAQAGVAL